MMYEKRRLRDEDEEESNELMEKITAAKADLEIMKERTKEKEKELQAMEIFYANKKQERNEKVIMVLELEITKKDLKKLQKQDFELEVELEAMENVAIRNGMIKKIKI